MNNDKIWARRRDVVDLGGLDSITAFVNTPTRLIFSVRGVPGVDVYIEKRLNKMGIRTACDLVNLYESYKNIYGDRTVVTIDRYLDRLGIMQPRRGIIVTALAAHSSERELRRMRVKSHKVIDTYFD